MKAVARDASIAAVALSCLVVAAMHLVGAVSIATGWREEQFGSDGWPIEVVPTVLIAAVLALVGLPLLSLLRRWQRSPVPVLAGPGVAAWAAVGLSAGVNGWWACLPVLVGVLLLVAQRLVVNGRPPRHPGVTAAAE